MTDIWGKNDDLYIWEKGKSGGHAIAGNCGLRNAENRYDAGRGFQDSTWLCGGLCAVGTENACRTASPAGTVPSDSRHFREDDAQNI